MRFIGVVFLSLLCSCVSSPFASLNRFRDTEAILEELRTEIADLKHSFHAVEVEMRLLEENLENQTDSKVGQLAEMVDDLGRKVAMLDKNQEKVSADLKNLASHANQTTHLLSQYRDKIKEIDQKVETTAPLIKKEVAAASLKSYKVQAGDSLQKIAKNHNTSVEILKQINGLKRDTIFVGQVLQLPPSNE